MGISRHSNSRPGNWMELENLNWLKRWLKWRCLCCSCGARAVRTWRSWFNWPTGSWTCSPEASWRHRWAASSRDFAPSYAILLSINCLNLNQTSFPSHVTHNLVLSDHIWSYLIIFDHIWSYLIIFDHIWPGATSPGWTCRRLGHFCFSPQCFFLFILRFDVCSLEIQSHWLLLLLKNRPLTGVGARVWRHRRPVVNGWVASGWNVHNYNSSMKEAPSHQSKLLFPLPLAINDDQLTIQSLLIVLHRPRRRIPTNQRKSHSVSYPVRLYSNNWFISIIHL